MVAWWILGVPFGARILLGSGVAVPFSSNGFWVFKCAKAASGGGFELRLRLYRRVMERRHSAAKSDLNGASMVTKNQEMVEIMIGKKQNVARRSKEEEDPQSQA